MLRSKEVTLLAFYLTVICPIAGQDRPLGLQDVQASRISLTLSCVLSPVPAV